MKENRSLLLKASMTFGLGMGAFWVFKYLFFIWGTSSAMMSAVYWGLTFSVPVLAYMFTRRYQIMAGGKIGFFHAWQFGVLLYFFAALIVSLAHYAYYRYIAPPDLIASTLNQTIDLLRQQGSLPEDTLEAMSSIRITPIHMAIQSIFSNVFYGIIFSLPIAWLVSRKQDNNINTPNITNQNI